jgi:DNA polymerase-4
VGPVTAKRLREHGITTLVQVRAVDAPALRAAVGGMADWLTRLAHGQDDRPVQPNRAAKSSSSECTYAEDIADVDRIREEIDTMARENAAWLVEKGLRARTVAIKVRYHDFTTVTRNHSQAPTDNADEIARRAVALLARTEAGRRPVRLLGAGVHGLVTPATIEMALPFDGPDPDS